MKTPWPALCLALFATLCSGSLQAADAPLEKVSVRAVARFDFDRAALRDEDRATLLAEVAQMSDVTWQQVTAVGYTDSVGSSAYNRRLADRRAKSVRSYLLQKGLDAKMVSTRGLAEQAPVADNGSAEGRARNRRTEVQFEGVRAAKK